MNRYQKNVMNNKLFFYGLLIGLICSCQPASTSPNNNNDIIEVGEKFPNMTLKNEENKDFSIHDALGQSFVVYFYPKDDTPGCTKQACTFRDQFEAFSSLNAKVIGVSEDSPASHAAFKKKYNLPFTLLTDQNNQLRKKVGVPTGVMGLLPGRVTYIMDKEGIVRHIFNSQSNVNQHIEEALNTLKILP